MAKFMVFVGAIILSVVLADPECGAGEHYDSCAPVPCRGEFCPTSGLSPRSCPPREPCVGRCVCDFQRLRSNENRTCISSTECPAYHCPPNEAFRGCQTCEDCAYIRSDCQCSKAAVGNIAPVVACEPGCYCIEGFYRTDGLCVPYDFCPNLPSNCYAQEG